MRELDGKKPSKNQLQKVGDGSADSEPSTPESLVSVLVEQIQRGHLEIVRRLTSSAVLAVEIGLKLLRVKAIIPHGQFSKWIDKQLTPTSGITRRTAQRYMNFAKNEKHLLQYIKTAYRNHTGTFTDQQATEVLATLKMSDATRLLGLKKARTQRNVESADNSGAPPTESVIAFHEIEQAAKTFFHGSDFATYTAVNANDVRWEGQLLAVLPKTQALSGLIESGLEAYLHGPLDESLLILPFDPTADWMSDLDRYPRVWPQRRLELPTATKRTPSKPGHIIVALTERYAAFHDSFSEFGGVFVPYVSDNVLED